MINQPLMRSTSVATDSPSDLYLTLVREASPVVSDTLDQWGDQSLSSYLATLLHEEVSWDHKYSQFLSAVEDCVEPLLGEHISKRVCNELREMPGALTTNHHGVDTFAQSVQGSLILSRRRNRWGRRMSTVPVFACGGVPLDNLTYPMGILLYHPTDGNFDAMPRKLPLFTNRYRRELVSVAPPITEEMVNRTRQRLAKLAKGGEIDGRVNEALEQILQEDYLCDSVQTQKTYSDQAVILNHRIWQRLFSRPDEKPDLVYIELEKLAARLLERDLADGDSLAYQVLFEPKLTVEILHHLDGAVGCWNEIELAKRSCSEHANPSGCGTLFFWGINEKNRRVPLRVKDGMMTGVDDQGQPWSHPYNARDIVAGLRSGRILPSLFTCFLTIAFDRGINCLGGYHQAAYLPDMQSRLVAALGFSQAYDAFANKIRSRCTDSYLAGMQPVVNQSPDGALFPAGVGEIIAAGGLCDEHLETLESMTLTDAHVASLLETVPELVDSSALEPGWKAALALDCGERLYERVATL